MICGIELNVHDWIGIASTAMFYVLGLWKGAELSGKGADRLVKWVIKKVEGKNE